MWNPMIRRHNANGLSALGADEMDTGKDLPWFLFISTLLLSFFINTVVNPPPPPPPPPDGNEAGDVIGDRSPAVLVQTKEGEFRIQYRGDLHDPTQAEIFQSKGLIVACKNLKEGDSRCLYLRDEETVNRLSVGEYRSVFSNLTRKGVKIKLLGGL